jgi:hypothetical protein
VGKDKNFCTPVWCTAMLAIIVEVVPNKIAQKLSLWVKSSPKLQERVKVKARVF